MDWWWLIALMLLVRGLGLDMIGVARMGSAIRELHAARRELARLAVIEERERLSRDLHDLLGQTLSMITLKSELARHLVTEEPERCAQELSEIERVARQTLREVREAVAGYRQPTLASELEGARQLLEAAGIELPDRTHPAGAPTGRRRRARLDGARRGDQRHPPQSGAALSHSSDPQERDSRCRGAQRWRPTRTGGKHGASRPGACRPAGAGVYAGRRPGGRPTCAPGQRTLSLSRGTAHPEPGRRDGFAGGMLMIRVLLAEDQAMVRGALAALLSREQDIEVVAEVARGDEVVEAALATQPDVALLDIEMPGGDGLAAAQALREALPTCRSVILTTFGRSGYLRRAMESGAVGFLLKDAPASELAVALRRVMEGERVVDPDLALAALSEGSNPLTPREREVLSASLFGASLAEIAARLYLSEGTVRNHLSTAMQKLGAQNRMEAARLAEQKGWL